MNFSALSAPTKVRVVRVNGRETLLKANIRTLTSIASSTLKAVPASKLPATQTEWVNFFLQTADLTSLRKTNGDPLPYVRDDVHRIAPISGLMRKFVCSPEFGKLLSDTISKK